MATAAAFGTHEEAELEARAVKGDTRFFQEFFARPGVSVAEKLNQLENMSQGTSTALHFAASYGHISLVMLLLSFGVNPNITNRHGSTPLHYASFKNLVEIVDLLLKKGAGPSLEVAGRSTLWYGSSTPLEFAEMHMENATRMHQNMTLVKDYDSFMNMRR
eukprot:TRINITY_DN22554_c0_g1_i3.p1 TRINITY_DN22554_c0_g1~~TRINITY_DN22554_c0_g1_i3.p1  ORF type:complete len:161 (-),score=48.76 TRINITY_DN22554_c0_g1_i3:197-679(-)